MKTGNTQVLLRIPSPLLRAIAKEARTTGTTRQAVMLEIIASHYGIPVKVPKRGRVKIL